MKKTTFFCGSEKDMINLLIPTQQIIHINNINSLCVTTKQAQKSMTNKGNGIIIINLAMMNFFVHKFLLKNFFSNDFKNLCLNY